MKLRISIVVIGLILVIIGGVDFFINAKEYSNFPVTGNYVTPGFDGVTVGLRFVSLIAAGIILLIYGFIRKSGSQRRR